MIYHFWGHANGLYKKDIFNQLWFSYFVRTPFYSAETLLELVESISSSAQDIGFLWKSIANLSPTRRRGFFIYPNDAEKIVNFIGKNDEDIGLNAQFPNALDILISTMEEQRGKIMFFIKVKDNEYAQIRDALRERGFLENQDFFNVKDFLMSSYNERLVREM